MDYTVLLNQMRSRILLYFLYLDNRHSGYELLNSMKRKVITHCKYTEIVAIMQEVIDCIKKIA